jgi:hypothetical protein
MPEAAEAASDAFKSSGHLLWISANRMIDLPLWSTLMSALDAC